jgi:hypothetical protein
MTIPSQFANWLAVSARDGRGGLQSEPPAIQRGRALSMELSLAAHPFYGNWTAGTFTADLRAAPGASGSALAVYTCTTGTPAGGLTPVTLVLSAVDSAALPTPPATEQLGEVFLEVTYTPTGGSENAILSTRQLVGGII